MPVNKLFDVGQREVIFFIYVSYLTRESTLYFLNVNKYWHDRKRWEKETNIVKGARFCYCRIYHKFVNFIILNLFKVVKSCFILLRGILILWYGSQINAPNYTKSKQTLTRSKGVRKRVKHCKRCKIVKSVMPSGKI
jgi:hypothetical protein